MDRTERFYKIDLLIRRRGGVGLDELMAALEVSRATLMRDLRYLRERIGAPIICARSDGLYRFAPSLQAAARELPGLWFSDQEIHALLSMHQLIQGLDSEAVLARHLQPLLDKLHGMLGAGDVPARELMRRVKIIGAARRSVQPQAFELVGSALFTRRRLHLRYYTRTRRSESQRVVSPQRLVHYRNTWYLDAWCHRSRALRRFALDAMRAVAVLAEPAREVAAATVERELDGSYGVFAGRARRWALLRFSADAAQWVAQEQWHAQQKLLPQADGSLHMRLPYADATELVMDILRHGPNVQVLAPADLAAEVRSQLDAALRAYQPSSQ